MWTPWAVGEMRKVVRGHFGFGWHRRLRQRFAWLNRALIIRIDDVSWLATL